MQSLITILREVRDPREFNARHDLASMLFIALAATLCGAKSCIDIADFAEGHASELAEIVDLPHGAPSHDSFSRIFRLLDPDELARAFAAFVAAMREGLGLGPAKGIVAVDGKRMRRGYERGRAFMPPLLVAVWDAETRLSLRAQAVPDGNEVAATLAALKSVALKGCIVTADALHCHPAMAAGVRDRRADYALKVKANNAPLFEGTVAAFAAADARGKVAIHETSNRGHDRSECRRGSVIAAPAALATTLPGLKALGRIESERISAGGKVSRAVHYVVLSRLLKPERMLQVVRTHWSVENHLHRQLDVVFFEDDARSRKNNAPANLSVIRRMALDILRAHPDPRSPARKMNLALWNRAFFNELFTHLR
jgi:predicted transposase YbfD/YdcC